MLGKSIRSVAQNTPTNRIRTYQRGGHSHASLAITAARKQCDGDCRYMCTKEDDEADGDGEEGDEGIQRFQAARLRVVNEFLFLLLFEGPTQRLLRRGQT